MPRPYYPLGFLDGIGRKIAAVSKVSELQPIYSLRRQQHILSLEPLRHAFEPSYFKPLYPPSFRSSIVSFKWSLRLLIFQASLITSRRTLILKPRKGSSALHSFALRLERSLLVVLVRIPFFPSTPPPMAVREDFS